jgi:uncharacterized protein YbjT (DUF2867 family)
MTGFVDTWVDAAMQGSVGRIVLNIGGTPGPADEHPFFADLHTARDRVSRSGLPYVILQPTVYFDNLAAPWAADALAAGTIAYPADPAATVSWLSHRTLGSWVVAVADGAQDGRVVPIGGPQALTGPELAAEIGAALGRPLTYVSVPPSAFGEGLNAVMGAPAGDRLASIYARLSQHLRSMEVDPSDAISLGVELETARQFASRVLA